MKYLTILLLLSFACGKKDIPEKSQHKDISHLEAAYEEKIKKAKETFDQETGWPSKEDCDGLLWAGLARASGLDSVQIGLAEYAAGELGRRPAPNCFRQGIDYGAPTTISRDMVLGYMWARWAAGDGTAIQRLKTYGEGHAWIMGEPIDAFGEVLLNGNLIGLIGRMTCKLASDCPEYRKIPALNSYSFKDYVQHLTTLFILLDGEVDTGIVGNVRKSDLDLLKMQMEENPNDALFNAAYHLYEDGDFEHAISMLLADKPFVPTYVRGSDNYSLVHWLFTARLIIKQH